MFAVRFAAVVFSGAQHQVRRFPQGPPQGAPRPTAGWAWGAHLMPSSSSIIVLIYHHLDLSCWSFILISHLDLSSWSFIFDSSSWYIILIYHNLDLSSSWYIILIYHLNFELSSWSWSMRSSSSWLIMIYHALDLSHLVLFFCSIIILTRHLNLRIWFYHFHLSSWNIVWICFAVRFAIVVSSGA